MRSAGGPALPTRSKGFLASLTAAVALASILTLVLHPEYAIALGAAISGEGALVISLPRDFKPLNLSSADSYYVEVWAVTPDAVVEVYKGFLDPGRPILKLAYKDLRVVVERWLEHYRAHGDYWRPSLLIQVSAYSRERGATVNLFGASVVYDPRLFVDRFPRVEVRGVGLGDFTVIKKRGLKLGRSSPTLNTHGVESGVLPTSTTTTPALPYPYPTCRTLNCDLISCDCCEPDSFFSRWSIVETLFDSSNPSIPEYLRDKVPVVIVYRDPDSPQGAFDAAYIVEGSSTLRFRVTLLGSTGEYPIFGGASGELNLNGRYAYSVATDSPNTVRFAFWQGSYKLYSVWFWDCCTVRRCSGYGCYNENYCQPGGGGLLMIVTYAAPYGDRSPALSPSEFPVDINLIRQRKPYTSVCLDPNREYQLSRDPYNIRLSLVNLAMAAALSKLGVPWQWNAALAAAVDNMPIAVELVYGWGAREELRLTNGGTPRCTDIYLQVAIYPQGPDTFKWTLIHVK